MRCKTDDKSSGDGGALFDIERQTIWQHILRTVYGRHTRIAALKHGIDHVVQLNEEPTVNACMINEPFLKDSFSLLLTIHDKRIKE